MTQEQQRWTRDYVFDVLRELGIHYIFGVPGTNEIPIIDGTSYPENSVQYIECLHENIAIGAAMGSARMSGKPGVLVVHVTPGIAHSIGNLFNAWRSHVPLVILCGQQQNELVTQEPLLASNLVDLARQYTKWAHEVRTPEERFPSFYSVPSKNTEQMLARYVAQPPLNFFHRFCGRILHLKFRWRGMPHIIDNYLPTMLEYEKDKIVFCLLPLCT